MSVVKINGLSRLVPTASTANVTLTGVTNTAVNSGVVQDTNGNNWNLPASVVIPSSGSITVTATCQVVGSIAAAAGTITQIITPTIGWQTVTNSSAAIPGNPVETDSALRQRQSISTMLPSQTVMQGIVAAIAAVPGVTKYAVFENDSSSTDSNGIPAGNICFVVQGGDSTAIATAIATKKTPGVPTYGTTLVSAPVSWSGTPLNINFIQPTAVTINVAITLHALTGYTTVIGSEIQSAVSAYINSLAIGQSVMLPRLYVPASLAGPYAAPASPNDATTYELVSIQIASGSGTLGSADITMPISSVATCSPSNVTITVS